MTDHLPDAAKMVPAPITLADMREAVARAIMTPSGRDYADRYHDGMPGAGDMATADAVLAVVAHGNAAILRRDACLLDAVGSPTATLLRALAEGANAS